MNRTKFRNIAKKVMRRKIAQKQTYDPDMRNTEYISNEIVSKLLSILDTIEPRPSANHLFGIVVSLAKDLDSELLPFSDTRRNSDIREKSAKKLETLYKAYIQEFYNFYDFIKADLR